MLATVIPVALSIRDTLFPLVLTPKRNQHRPRSVGLEKPVITSVTAPSLLRIRRTAFKLPGDPDGIVIDRDPESTLADVDCRYDRQRALADLDYVGLPAIQTKSESTASSCQRGLAVELSR